MFTLLTSQYSIPTSSHRKINSSNSLFDDRHLHGLFFFFLLNISKGAEREVLKVQSCLKESSEGSGWGRVGAISTQIQKLAVPRQRMLLLHLNTQPNIEFRLGFFCFFPQPFNTRSTEFVAVGSVVLLISLSLKGQKGMKLQ